jgi:hypothetical protein
MYSADVAFAYLAGSVATVKTRLLCVARWNTATPGALLVDDDFAVLLPDDEVEQRPKRGDGATVVGRRIEVVEGDRVGRTEPSL